MKRTVRTGETREEWKAKIRADDVMKGERRVGGRRDGEGMRSTEERQKKANLHS